MQTYDSTISVAQPEELLPECEPDDDYDPNVTCSTPFKYIKQKWLLRRDREVRYKVDKASTQQFDERRLIDMRFWLYIGVISNCLFQIPSTIKPMTPEQYEVNLYYWGITVLLVVLMILSFTWSMELLNVASCIFMARNIAPLFDFEKRKDVMGREGFNLLVNFQMIIIVMHLMLLNNNLETSMILILPLTLFGLFYGLVEAVFGGADAMSVYSSQIFITLQFGSGAFVVFLYLQKRVHKEVFLGFKNRQHQQNEFKTIFDQLDEAVVITSQDKLHQMNQAFKHFVTKNFSDEAASHLEDLSKMHEENELTLENEREEKKASKCKKCFSVFCCWTPNKRNNVVLKNTTMYQEMISS